MDGRSGHLRLTTATLVLFVFVPVLVGRPSAAVLEAGHPMLALTLGDADGRPLGPELVVAALPGETRLQVLTIRNRGPAVTFSLRVEAADLDGRGLRAAVRATIRTAGTTCRANSGQLLYEGSLAAASIGDPAFGAQPGDRSLAQGASERLCLWSSLPLSTGDSLQGATTQATILLVAEPAGPRPAPTMP